MTFLATELRANPLGALSAIAGLVAICVDGAAVSTLLAPYASAAVACGAVDVGAVVVVRARLKALATFLQL